MATQAQTNFVNTYGPYAQQAGATLGVSPNIILGQWAQESGWGTAGSAAAAGNMAGINVPGSTTGTNYQGYSSPQAFTQSYINTIQTNFPGAMNTGSDPNAFNAGLTSGRGGRLYYTGDQTTYLNNVTSNANTVAAINPGLASGGTVTGNSGIATSPTAGTGPAEGGTGFSPVTDPTGGPASGFGSYPGSGYTATSPPGQTFYTYTNPDGTAGLITDPTFLPPGATLGEPLPQAAGNTAPGSIGGGGAGSSAGTSTGGAGDLSGLSGFGGAAGAGQPGFLPPAQTGGPMAVGITAGLASGINNWITGAETAVGNAFKNAFSGMLGGVENLTIRFFLVLAAVVVLGIALWRIAAPNVSPVDVAKAAVA